MSSAFFQEMAALASEFTTGEMFADAVLTRVTRDFDPVTSTVATTPQAIPCRAVTRETVIRAATGVLERLTTATLNVEPTEGDKLQIGAQSYTLGAVTRIAPDGNAILYRAVAM